MVENSITILVDYIHNAYACESHKHKDVWSIFSRTSLTDAKGYYNTNYDRITKVLLTSPAEEVIQILAQEIPLNILEIKKILGYSYGTIHKVIGDLKKFRIITTSTGTSTKGRREIRISINKPNVKIINISDKEKDFLNLIDKQLKDSEKAHKELSEWLKRRKEEIPSEPTNKNTNKK